MGGNLFSDVVQPISINNINSTLEAYYKELSRVFPNKTLVFKEFKTIGSAGKKEVSGDIDLAISVTLLLDSNLSDGSISTWGIDPSHVDIDFLILKKRSRTATDYQLKLKAFLLNFSKKLNYESSMITSADKKVGSGSLFTYFPQYNGSTKLDINVQIDWMIGDINWLVFSYYSDVYKGNVKGLHRTQMILSLFNHKELIFNHSSGVKRKSDNQIVATEPKEAIEVLNEAYGINLTQDILSNYFTLREYLEKYLTEDDYSSIINIYLKILSRTRCDIPEDLQDNWREKQEELELSTKFLPKTSKLFGERYYC